MYNNKMIVFGGIAGAFLNDGYEFNLDTYTTKHNVNLYSLNLGKKQSSFILIQFDRYIYLDQVEINKAWDARQKVF